MKPLLFSALVFLFVMHTAFSQEISYGFKAGLNVSTILGDLEKNDQGMEIEELNMNTGFHVGPTVTVRFTDNYGLRGELLFSQKGLKYHFDGQSYFILNSEADNRFITTGNRRVSLNVFNSYIDIPILGYARLGKFEFSGGINAAFLVASNADGELIYSGETDNGSRVEQFVVELDYNYFSDSPGGATFDEPADMIIVEGEPVLIPRLAGAYYEYPEDKGNLYQTLDIGLNAGISYFLNPGLYLSIRANYGLTDVTKNVVDRSLVSLNGQEFEYSDDKDKMLSLQASIGFSF